MAFLYLILVFFIEHYCGGYLISIAYCPFFFYCTYGVLSVCCCTYGVFSVCSCTYGVFSVCSCYTWKYGCPYCYVPSRR